MVKTFARHVSPLDMMNVRHAWKIDDNHYKVYGRDGVPYTIFVVIYQGRLIVCACPCHAGSHGEVCFHATKVIARLTREKKIYG